MGTEPAVLFGSTSDAPTPVDTLGFEPYVESIARFLESPTTMPPLTISVEGEWGSRQVIIHVAVEEPAVCHREEPGRRRIQCMASR